jgi:pimeloyl-ACP methyl ester carboxylesterase
MELLIDRGFIRVEEGLVHYRSCGEATAEDLPLYMIHASPASSLLLENLMLELGDSRKIYAPDTLGNGDSAPQGTDEPDMAYLADSVRRVFDTLGIDKADVYGSHTGAHIACELAIAAPDRVNRIIFDGIAMFSENDRKDFLENYAPEVKPDDMGLHLTWAWNFVRDQVLYFPYFRRTPEYQRNVAMASPEKLHKIVLDVLKGLTTYHRNYHAAFRHADVERLPLIPHKTLCMAVESDPLYQGVNRAADLMQNADRAIAADGMGPAGISHAAEIMLDFLGSP